MSAHLMSSHLISSHLISSLLFSSLLFSSLLFSSLLFSSHIFQALLTSPHLTSALVGSSHPISASSSQVKTSYLSLLLTGASPLISVPSQRDTAAPFPCRRHEKFICKAIVCAVRNDAHNPSSAALRADGTWISLRRLAACVIRGYPRNSHGSFDLDKQERTDPSTSTRRSAQIHWEFTWIFQPWRAGLHGYPRNSHGSSNLDKQEHTDTLGIQQILWPRQTDKQECTDAGCLKNSYESFDLDKQDCTDTFRIHVNSSTSTSRSARIP